MYDVELYELVFIFVVRTSVVYLSLHKIDLLQSAATSDANTHCGLRAFHLVAVVVVEHAFCSQIDFLTVLRANV